MKKLSIVILIGFASLVQAQQPAFIQKQLDTYINKGLVDWDVPGLAIVVVKDGKTVVMKGYGYRTIKKDTRVDENTLFMIASNTKLFTATALAWLAQRGLMSLDDKITKYFPGYRLYDSNSTAVVTVRDLLCHRIGTKTFQGDFTFWNSDLSRQQIMERMRLLKPSAPFRQEYGYCNSCFLTAGQVIEKVTGQPWEVFVHDSIVQQLGMTSTMTLSTGIDQQKNVAEPYTTSYTGNLTRVPYDRWDNLGPAASIVSNVKDLSHWLMFQLDSGRYQNRQVIPFSALQDTRDMNIVLSSRKSRRLPTHIVGYGLGLFSSDYDGRQVYWHTGGAAGMVSNVCFVPEERLGIAILTNNDNQVFFEALRYQLLDAYLGMPFVDRSQQQLRDFKDEMSDQLSTIEGWKKRVKGNKPALPLEAYTGRFIHPLYGHVDITAKDNRLVATFEHHPGLQGSLEYMDHDKWLLRYNNVEYGIFETGFKTEGGKCRSVILPVNPFVEMDPYEFIRQEP